MKKETNITNKKEFSYDFLGRKLVVEVGNYAAQANGAVLVRYGDTVVLTACVMSDTMGTGDFFPLTVVYNEKLYSVGKIPGGFIKREGKASESATLAARLIDRPIRPLFDEGFRNEVQVVDTVLSVDQDIAPEMTALFGSSLAITISDIPFDGPSLTMVLACTILLLEVGCQWIQRQKSITILVHTHIVMVILSNSLTLMGKDLKLPKQH